MSVPFSLGSGIVSIYNTYSPSLYGIVPATGYNYGLIDQISNYNITFAQVGKSVLFKGNAILTTIRYGNWNYRLIPETAILATEHSP